MASEDFDITLPSGRVRVRRWGDATRPAVFGVPGLTANLACFEPVAGALETAGFQTLVHDMRGRGYSDVTPPGTYGWPSHAADVIGIADALGHERFDFVGWSTGCLIGLHIAQLVPDRLRRLVLLDQVCAVDRSVADIIKLAIERLGTVHPSLPDYTAMIQGIGLIRPWSDVWERYFVYEMAPVDGGYSPRSSLAAVMEDFEWDLTHDGRDLWAHVRCPVLLVRGRESLMPGSSTVVPEPVLHDFLAALPGTELLELDLNHYGVGTSPAAAAATVEFLNRPVVAAARSATAV